MRYFQFKNKTHAGSFHRREDDITTGPRLADYDAELDAGIHKVREADGELLATLRAIKRGQGCTFLQKGLVSQRSKAVSDATELGDFRTQPKTRSNLPSQACMPCTFPNLMCKREANGDELLTSCPTTALVLAAARIPQLGLANHLSILKDSTVNILCNDPILQPYPDSPTKTK